jgi:hypothetical protein
LNKEVQKRIKTREAEEREKEDLVKQDTLVLSQNVSLDHWRRTLTKHRTTHHCVWLYNNIKIGFFQLCDG